MFDFVRTHQRGLQAVLLLLILPAFVFTGFSTLGGGKSDQTLAKVGAKTITVAEFEQRYKGLIESQREQNNGQVDLAGFNTLEMKHAALTQMVNEALTNELIQTGQRTVSAPEWKQALVNQSQVPKNAQGEVDEAAYSAKLKQAGLTPAQHQVQVRDTLAREHLSLAYESPVLPYNEQAMASFFGRARQVEIKSIDLTPYIAQVTVTPEQVKAHFDQYAATFALPARYDIEYATVSMGKETTAVTDADIKAEFGQDATPEQLLKVRQNPAQLKTVFDKVVLKKRAAQIDALIAQSPKDLERVAQGLTIPVQRISGATPEAQPQTLANTPLQDPNVRQAIVNPTLGESKAIGPIVPLANGDLLIARISQYQAAGARTFEQAKADAEQALKRRLAIAKAVEDTQKSLTTWSAQTAIAPAQTLSWLGGVNASEAIVRAAMSHVGAVPALTLAHDEQRVDVLRLVGDTPLSPAQSQALLQKVQKVWLQSSEGLAYDAYMAVLRERAGVKMYGDRLEKITLN